MNSCSLLELCKCSGPHTCLFCKILTLFAIAIISGIAGYLAGKKKRNKSTPKIKE